MSHLFEYLFQNRMANLSIQGWYILQFIQSSFLLSTFYILKILIKVYLKIFSGERAG